MKRVIELNSKNEKKVDVLDFETVDIVSNNSMVLVYAETVVSTLKNILSLKFKDANFKVLVTGDDYADDYSISNVKVLLQNKEQIKYVKESLTEDWEYGLLAEEVIPAATSNFKERCKLWCNKFNYFIANTFGFKGVTRVVASAHNDELISFDIIVCGKGTNDNIVRVAKEISEIMVASKDYALYMVDEDIFGYISAFFES